MDTPFSIDSLGSRKPFSLTSKPQAALKTDSFQKIMEQQQKNTLSATDSIKESATHAMAQADEAFAKMERIRIQIEAEYRSLIEVLQDDHS